jgi:hypothetical protein
MRQIHVIIAAAGLLAAAQPIQARVVAIALSGDGARIELHDQAGPCVGAARMAEHVVPGGQKVAGCWLADDKAVRISFLDGERGMIPLAHLKAVDDAAAVPSAPVVPASRPARSASRAGCA